MKTITVKIPLTFVFLTIVFIDASLAESPKAEPLSDHLNHTIKKKDAQAEEVELQLNRDYWAGYVTDTKSILTSPSRWESSDWMKASVIMAMTVGLYAYDQDIRDWVQDNRNDTTDKIAKTAKPFGDGMYTLPALGGFYLYGSVLEDEKAQTTALLSLESFAVSGMFIQVMKFTGHRHRPNSGDPPDTWDGPGFSISHLSFPSGHSSAAFSVATVIASEYDDIVLVPPLAYGIATLAALSRINDDAHWASDIFFGSAIGYFTAKAIFNLHNNSKKDRNFAIIPIIDGPHAGLLIAYGF